MKEAMFWDALPEGRLQCVLCPHNCVIRLGGRGFCRVRRNIEGMLFNESYGAVTAVNMDPIEKKPLFHFKPGSNVYSIGTYGCNLACDFCQNHQISQGNPSFVEYSPMDVVRDSKRHDCIGVAYTYSEPITWIEFVMDVSRINDGYNILVTNGYINDGPLKELAAHIDAANIDVKGDSKFYKGLCHSPYIDVAKNVRTMYEAGVHVEVTNLIIPGYNDGRDTIRGIAREIADISVDIPMHFSRFYPHFKMSDVSPTPVASLEMAYGLAKEEGIKYVYIGNVPGACEDTICPGCGRSLVKRSGFHVERNAIEDGKCPECGEHIYGKW
ncbi:MAG TPA: AmmeMemoRadiSam system radical SAM enzyme [Candidatus Methanofastidiosa archaeon]|nr:AmmeMemoRadiSam system radical SAM enzyme [Candidatus Methanofastidiosa archaeon]